VDDAALVAALESGHLAGAALDVYDMEPLPADSVLRRAPNLVMTPHLGASTREAQVRVSVETAEAVREFLLRGDISAAVNRPALEAAKA
jgi:D-3-phosphoglycerate dehydrogenase